MRHAMSSVFVLKFNVTCIICPKVPFPSLFWPLLTKIYILVKEVKYTGKIRDFFIETQSHYPQKFKDQKQIYNGIIWHFLVYRNITRNLTLSSRYLIKNLDDFVWYSQFEAIEGLFLTEFLDFFLSSEWIKFGHIGIHE